MLKLFENEADVRLVDRPKQASIRVPLNRLRICPEELHSGEGSREDIDEGEVTEDGVEPGAPINLEKETSDVVEESSAGIATNKSPWAGRLQTRKAVIEDDEHRSGDV